MTQERVSQRRFISSTFLSGLAACMKPSVAFSMEPAYSIGCYTRPWDQFDFRTALDGIAEAGFQHAGLMTAKGKSWVMITPDTTSEEVESIALEVKQRKLKTISIFGGDFPVAKSIPAGIAGLNKLIDHCVICSCPNLLLGGTADAGLVRDYYKVVRECCDYASSKGVCLTIKPHGGQNATGPQCRKIIEEVGHKNFRLWYDPGNIYYYSDGKLDPVNDSTTVNNLVVGVSVKDFLPPKEVMVTPGSGRVNFTGVFQNLLKGGFAKGPLVVECVARRETAALVTAEAKKARAFLHELVGKIK